MADDDKKGEGKSAVPQEAEAPVKVLQDVTFEGVIEYIKSGKCKNIITMAGAGISTSAGIPDFRSPGSGLYDNLQKYDLPSPECIFELGFFDTNPEPFFQLARELWPGELKPTPTHYFVRLLSDEGLLLRHYTQNIDTLEYLAGIPTDKIIEAHGSFHQGHCRQCGKMYSQDWLKEQIFKGETVSVPTCEVGDCEGVVKPDIVFFGEALPPNFFMNAIRDLPKCDLLIIMGTSLKVHPFAALPHRVPDSCPRLYLNLENTTVSADPLTNLMMGLSVDGGYKFDQEDNIRDVFKSDTCDNGCLSIVKLLGWEEKFKKLQQPDASPPGTSADKNPAAKH